MEELPDYFLSTCSGLSEISLPSSLRTIGNNAFNGCNGIKDLIIPDGVESIGYEGIAWCENLESVTIGEGLKSFDMGLFVICNNLKTIIWNAIDAAEVSNGGIAAPSPETVIFGEKVEVVPYYFCYAKTSLANVIFGSSVKEIQEGAFRGCSNLTRVELPSSLETIGKYGFMSTGIETIIIPENVKLLDTWSLGDSNFKTIVLTPIDDLNASGCLIDASNDLIIYVTNEDLYSEWPNASLAQYVVPLVTPDKTDFFNTEDMAVSFSCNIPGYEMNVTNMPALETSNGLHNAIIEADFVGEQDFSAEFIYKYLVNISDETGIDAISDPEGHIEIYLPNGMRIATFENSESLNVLPSGLYILKSASGTKKIIL